ncbi:nitrite reductase small subunit NirD [Stutzerimonas xanthomarina]|uniref:Nitrite reductase (NADH) small subunit n=2 Tax=Stutzerimonas xanthomarina TaxID=271420 RepID=A0A1M5MCX5_9GAMM|nr:nitrite reductase small subunit NirD [Stutzerimonas xanthomarina]MCP9338931.1 nitrite reductase small subunit NirD [Stutzerimonas xanthomarina]SEH90808.1 nitrite reductase (NADH) small subunit [Stutzerimonas xanthomarina]SHG75076.1 nitrite reductase (NADH) small subunit [Stutzerimonas xanthomarina DSM 18231]
MSQSNALRMQPSENVSWRALCSRRDLVANSGVVAWLDDEQVALFHLPETETGEKVFAVANKDPKSGANVIGRGILGQLKGDLVIASPLYKQHFRLQDGACLEYPEQRLRVWAVRLKGEAVEIAVD